MNPEKIHLENKKGRFEMTLQEAELKLRAKKVNPSQTWKLPQNSDYKFDGKNILKKPEDKPKKS